MAATTGTAAADRSVQARSWPTVAFLALAHLGLLLADPESLSFTLLTAAETGIFAVAVGIETVSGHTYPRLTAVGTTTVALLAFGGVTLALAAAVSLPVAAVGVVTVGALAGYGLHRYELVALGLVEVPDEPE